ncbi:MAG: beta-ribofuranosylaminobenzene 5'-phosphate synthase [Beijerinckiaceae bacterium]
MNGGLGRRFGSLGLSIDAYETCITLSHAPASRVRGPDAARAERILSRIKNAVGTDGTYCLSIERAIPAHIGLGSGTQMALAIAAALHHLEHRAGDLADYAALTERGARSGAGIGLFATGGFVVDAGRAASTRTAPIVARLAFPEEWRIILVTDPEQQGASGAAEDEAFAELPEFSAAHAAEICRCVLMQILPALIERDLGSFGHGISSVQAIVGDHFAPVQGGSRFKSSAVEAVVAKLANAGATGLGQTSWGPTGFAFAADSAAAESLVSQVVARAEEMHLDIRISRGLNRGAIIEEQTPRRAESG